MKLGLDIGNSTVKGSILDDNNVLLSSLRFPSAVVHISDPKYLSYPNDDDFYIQVVDSQLEHFPGIVAVGKKAIEMPDYKEFDVTSTSYKTNHPITTSLLFGAIAPFVQGDVSIKLAVSIPVNESKNLGLIDEYKQLLIGEHRFMIYTKTGVNRVSLTITSASVLTEGQAGFLGMLDTVDYEFRKALDAVYLNLGEDLTTDPVKSLSDFLIVDIGEGTTDFAVFRDKRYNPYYSYSVTKGYGNLLEDAIEKAALENLTIESRKDLQKVIEDTSERRKSRREKWESYVKPTKKAFIDVVVDMVLKTYRERDYFDAIIFIGGGFTALTGYTVVDGKVVVVDNSLFEEIRKALDKTNKDVDLLFGIPSPYSQGINERGLTQVLTML